ncbi:uracil-DNA glycosylase family protein [Costertonia aggregata]|uniref:Uracil-DNA glycosylase family protein n=1 Tax=Costertonia aggregata TaxID=343403 RepID=A0A7H9ALC5_9FLAO|nr:uracil-DNA glycosylase family protein [Costertonia aggregata]QLG44266.1 uracil-DNA glycosylase family protein [Costertonia aggregata]
MFLHTHPYKPFIFKEATKLIVGTLPPPRFTTGDLKGEDVDFCYGSKNGQLWPILDKIFDLGLRYETTQSAIEQRKSFLLKRKIGVCDIVASAERHKIDASDLGMQNIKLRNVIGYLLEYPKVNTLLFTGGNSKNGPEYFFRKHLKEHDIKYKNLVDEVPRIHEFILLNTGRTIKTVSLTAPSGAANRAIGSLALYKKLKHQNPNFTTFDFRVMQYRPFF